MTNAVAGFLTPTRPDKLKAGEFFYAGRGSSMIFCFMAAYPDETPVVVAFTGPAATGKPYPMTMGYAEMANGYAHLTARLPFPATIEPADGIYAVEPDDVAHGGLVIDADGTPWLQLSHVGNRWSINLVTGLIDERPQTQRYVNDWRLVLVAGDRRAEVFSYPPGTAATSLPRWL